jgi:hypothetical protein
MGSPYYAVKLELLLINRKLDRVEAAHACVLAQLRASRALGLFACGWEWRRR